MSVHDIPPAERLRLIYTKMRAKPSFKRLPADISSVIQNQPGDLKKFTYKVGKHTWRGYIYGSRNSLYGTIFSYFGRTPFIVRGFPKIDYAEKSRTFQQPDVYIEEKVDGTNIIVWQFPDGTFWGKTRETATIFEDGYQGRKWFDLIEKTGYVSNLKKYCHDTGNSIAFELYGNQNAGEFIKYTTPISIKVLEICRGQGFFDFVDPECKRAVCGLYDLPVVSQKEICALTQYDLDRLEYEAKALNHPDGMEGFVAKWFNPETNDVFMGKIKCAEIREACMGNKIPMHFIRKAVRKCQEAGVPLIIGFIHDESIERVNPDAVTFVKNELGEDFTETVINLNEIKIKYALENPVEEKELDLTAYEDKEIFAVFDELKNSGLEISEKNKGKILSLAAGRLPSIAGNRLFLTFRSYLYSQEVKQ